ncbi:hypothetical protein PACTADRAFT_26906, partial [Pachysolen tannophilus NRRL Y-2460]
KKVKLHSNDLTTVTATATATPLESEYKDLQPSIDENLKIIFIGFNPGVESSLQQHHYAHFTNLFWKLFNQSKILLKVLLASNVSIKDKMKEDSLLRDLIISSSNIYSTQVKAENDFDLVKYGIGFTDLILRCTRSAQELTHLEKLENVPRLIKELSFAKPKFVVIVGKGIWEFIVLYITKILGIKKLKLEKTIFDWGLQENVTNESYKCVLKKLKDLCGYDCKVYVFPNTSGLVASVKFEDKLKLWNELSNEI